MALNFSVKCSYLRSKLFHTTSLCFVRNESRAVFNSQKKDTLRKRSSNKHLNLKGKTEENVKDNREKVLESKTVVDTPAIVRMMLKDDSNNEKKSPSNLCPEDNADLPSSNPIVELEHRLKEITWDAKAVWEKSKLDATLSLSAKTSWLNKDITKENESLDISDFKFILGTGDSSIEMSDVPCSGCGALLHCQDPSVPGFLPSQKFITLTKEEMRSSKCQKCHLMHHYKVILDIKASDEEFKSIIKQIHKEKALILVVIDLIDMQNSIVRNLFQAIGKKRPIYIVGNKVDLMPKDKKGYLKRIEESLVAACSEGGLNPSGTNIRHVALVSAKTGYGIEQLITKLMLDWGLNGNVYMVGNTNSGKSTLFNALLHSDYCKSSVRDVIQSATVSIWPGTTINLLKFPIINPEPWRLYKRMMRVRKERHEWNEQQVTLKSQIRDRKKIQNAVSLATLKAPVHVTDFKQEGNDKRKGYEGFSLPSYSFSGGNVEAMEGRTHILSEEEKNAIVFDDNNFKQSKFLFDTPGVIDNSQVINLLNCDELDLLLPKTLIIPRVFLLKPNHVMFITGLARLDYVDGNQDVFVTVFSKSSLPVHVKKTEVADQFYEDFIGTSLLGIPLGDQDRLNKVPSLIGKHFHIQGECIEQQAIADIQLSSLGWVSFTPTAFIGDMDLEVRAYTSGGQGLHLRQPALILDTHMLHGTRIGKSYQYRPRKPKLLTH